MAILFDISPFLSLLESGGVILTPNRRLAAKMQQSFCETMAARGSAAFAAPAIYSLDEWVDRQWHSARERSPDLRSKAIISATQRRQLFFNLVKQDSSSVGMGVSQLAAQADQALQYIESWQVPLDEAVGDGVDGVECLRDWIKLFRIHIEGRKLHTREQGIVDIAEAFQTNVLRQGAQIGLVGFDQISPLHRHMLETAAEELVELSLPDLSGSVTLSSSLNTESELYDAALWARSILAKESSPSIGIIIPDLAQQRRQVERVFMEVFEPSYTLPGTPRYALPFNFSAGTSLVDVPVIGDALLLLKLATPSVDINALGEILLSPFWGDFDANQGARQGALKAARALQQDSVPLKYLYSVASDSDVLQLPAIGATASRCQARLPSEYAAFFVDLLAQTGWPGSRRPDSLEYQQIVAWYGALESFASLDHVVPGYSYLQAVQQLSQILAGTLFQPKTPNGPIQILGALEGASLQFSHCRVLGMSRSAWPLAPKPNALLPIHLQREHRMPRCDADRELSIAQSLTQSFVRCAPQVVLSYAKRTADDGADHASLLVADYSLQAEGPPSAASLLAENYAARATVKLEYFEDNCAPGIDTRFFKGGSGLLRAQSLCPLNAVATYRFGAQAPPIPYFGFSASDRGALLHSVLAVLWAHWRTQQAILDTPHDAIRLAIEAAVATAVDSHSRSGGLPALYLSLEKARLAGLVYRLVEIDRKREPFEVLKIEDKQTVSVGPLVLSIALDRIDQVADKTNIVIDYKTSKHLTLTAWAGDRPADPQLPLYSAFSEDACQGVAFCAANVERCGYLGVVADDVDLPGTTHPSKFREFEGGVPDWSTLRERWHHAITLLAQEFIEGQAHVLLEKVSDLRYDEHLLPFNRLLDADAINTIRTTS